LLLASVAAAAESPRVALEASHAREGLSGGRAPWTDSALQLELKWGTLESLAARLRETERFGLQDREHAIGGHVPLGSGWSAEAEYTASGTHRVLPRHSLLLQLGRQLGGGWGVYGGFRRSAYTQASADLRLFTLERYIGAGRFAYTFYSGKPEGRGSAPSHRLQWSHYFNDRDYVGISVGGGREVENVAPAGLLTSKVRSAYLTGRWWFAPDWALTGEVGVHEQGSLYRRHGIRLGLRHQF
jgi:YaiO family outer membrane protein